MFSDNTPIEQEIFVQTNMALSTKWSMGTFFACQIRKRNEYFSDDLVSRFPIKTLLAIVWPAEIHASQCQYTRFLDYHHVHRLELVVSLYMLNAVLSCV